MPLPTRIPSTESFPRAMGQHDPLSLALPPKRSARPCPRPRLPALSARVPSDLLCFSPPSTPGSPDSHRPPSLLSDRDSDAGEPCAVAEGSSPTVERSLPPTPVNHDFGWFEGAGMDGGDDAASILDFPLPPASAPEPPKGRRASVLCFPLPPGTDLRREAPARDWSAVRTFWDAYRCEVDPVCDLEAALFADAEGEDAGDHAWDDCRRCARRRMKLDGHSAYVLSAAGYARLDAGSKVGRYTGH